MKRRLKKRVTVIVGLFYYIRAPPKKVYYSIPYCILQFQHPQGDSAVQKAGWAGEEGKKEAADVCCGGDGG